jgi:hypothetical protein
MNPSLMSIMVLVAGEAGSTGGSSHFARTRDSARNSSWRAASPGAQACDGGRLSPTTGRPVLVVKGCMRTRDWLSFDHFSNAT